MDKKHVNPVVRADIKIQRDNPRVNRVQQVTLPLEVLQDVAAVAVGT